MKSRARRWLVLFVALEAVLGCERREQSEQSEQSGGNSSNPRQSVKQDAGVESPTDASTASPSDGSAGPDTGGTRATTSSIASSEPPGSGGTSATTSPDASSEPPGSGGTSDVTNLDPPKPPANSGGTSANRIVAIGDLHGDIGATRKAFQLAGATDENDNWIGGSLRIVQLGDLIGRSDDDRQVLDFVFDVRNQAEQAGGRVHNLIGNHEVMGGRVDNQAVGANPFPGFEDLPDLARDDPRLQILPENQRARGAALMAGGPYAQRFAEFPTVLQIGNTIYVHAGLVPRWAEYGIDKINAEVSQWLMGNTAEPDSSLGVDDGDRTMWTRQFSSAVDDSDCAALDQSLSILGAKRMIVAHTVQTAITALCNNKLWVVDVGMSRYYGGPVEVLEIVDDETLTVLRW